MTHPKPTGKGGLTAICWEWLVTVGLLIVVLSGLWVFRIDLEDLAPLGEIDPSDYE